MKKLDDLLKDSPTYTFYATINVLLKELCNKTTETFHNNYKRYWQLSFEEGPVSESFFEQIRVEFHQDLLGHTYFNVGVEHHFSIGDFGMKTPYFTKNRFYQIDLLEWSLMDEVRDNFEKAKQHLIQLTNKKQEETEDPAEFIRTTRLKDLFI